MHRGRILVGVVAVATLVTGPGASAAGADGYGRGTTSLNTTALKVSALGMGEASVAVTDAHATTDHGRAGKDDDGASAEMVALRVNGPDGNVLSFPDPPMGSKSKGGRNVESRTDAALTLPSKTTNGMAPGSLARAHMNPAHIEAWEQVGSAGALATSEIADVDLLGGLSRADGIGPGSHENWAKDGETAATADSLHIASATLLEMGPLMDWLGVDLAELPKATLVNLAGSLGLEEEARQILGDLSSLDLLSPEDQAQLADLLAGAPLLAVADVSESVQAVAAVQPDGEVMTAAHATGTVGKIWVGDTDVVNDFDSSEPAADWNSTEAIITHEMNSILGTLGEEYEDLVHVRVLPTLVEKTRLDDVYATARAQIRLLEVLIDPPAAAPDPDLPTDELLDELTGGGNPADNLPTADIPGVPMPSVPGAGSVLDEVGGGGGGVSGPMFGAADIEEGLRLVVGDMYATSEHTRPGVAPRCRETCGLDTSTFNRPWSPEEGFGDPGAPGGGDGLPRTGGSATTAALGGLALAGALGTRRWLASTPVGTAGKRAGAQPLGAKS